MSAPFLSNGWGGKGQLLVSAFCLLSNLGDAFMPESAWPFVLTNQIYRSILFSSSQRDLTPAIPTVDHILCTIVSKEGMHLTVRIAAQQIRVFGDCNIHIYIHI